MHTSHDYINMLPILIFSIGVSFYGISTSYDDWIMIFLSSGVSIFFGKPPSPGSKATWYERQIVKGTIIFHSLYRNIWSIVKETFISGWFIDNSVLSTYCNKNLHFSMLHHVTTWLPWKHNNSLTLNFFIFWHLIKF